MVNCKKFIFKTKFDGFPKESDMEIVEENLPELQDGEFKAQAVYFSVDPYMRSLSRRLPLGSTFSGRQIAKIIESKNEKFPVGKYVCGEFGWRTVSISSGQEKTTGNCQGVWLLPNFEDLPLSLGLGGLGIPGITAYFGFLELCDPKPGETVVVSGAAGAVGHLVGQIAKIKGCKVIGIAGSDAKGKWLKELGFDHCINYKSPNFERDLVECAPDGVDCYFDNVGGQISSAVLNQMNQFGRISLCGSISAYNDRSEPSKAAIVQPAMVSKQLKMEGFIWARWYDRKSEAFDECKRWIQEGKLRCREHVTEGFENTLRAFIEMLKGGNFGKAIVRA